MPEQTFGARLKQLREQAGLSQQELATKAGLHRFGVAKLERGEREPTWDTVQKLTQALGVKCAAFEGTTSGKPPADAPAPRRGRPPKPAEAKPTAGQQEPAEQPTKGKAKGRKKKG
jgi:transcriptional regulator with XRE-family HTH domain